MSSCYTTVTASVVQVASQGALGAMIDNLKTRQIDIFASAYYTTRPFAHGMEREATDQPIFATRRNQIKNKFEITRSFDLIYQLYLVIDLPGIRTCDLDGPRDTISDDDSWFYLNETNASAGFLAHYTNGVAAALIREVHLCMGGHSLTKLTGEQIYLYEELAGRPGKRLESSVGKAESALTLAKRSAKAQRLFLPMYFFFCATRGSVSSALNLIGAQFQKATIDMSLNSLMSVVEFGDNAGCISQNSGNAVVYVTDTVSTESMTSPVRASGELAAPSGTAGPLSEYEGARVTLDVLGITLNEADRQTFSTKDRMALMDEVTVIERTGSQSLKTASTTIDLTDYAKNLVYELQIAARLNKVRSLVKRDPVHGENWYGENYTQQGPMRFGGRCDFLSGLSADPLASLSLTISGQQRTQRGLESAYYNKVTPYMHHSTVPSQKGIYSMPFSLYPEDWNVPDSYANASKLDSMRLQIDLPSDVVAEQSANGGVDLLVFAHQFNVLVEQKGMKARFFV